MENKVRAIALYLPQFHPIPENDEWWGKGFTEWTNVGRAKKLFPGHNQPRVPADLGYYDLRVPEVREAQAQLAREAGIEGFAYWHYWFGEGRTLLERPFREVLQTGKPDFPFCLSWANHSWYEKTWDNKGADRLLIEQKYPGPEDYERHFLHVLDAFRDPRYIRVEGKPVFFVYSPCDTPELNVFFATWRELAIKHGLKGIYFIALVHTEEELERVGAFEYDALSFDPLYDFRYNDRSFRSVLAAGLHKLAGIPKIQSYKDYITFFKRHFPLGKGLIPCVNPNFDHTPRSGKRAVTIVGDTPARFEELLTYAVRPDVLDKQNILILRSWNEWAEGNYLEPDMRIGHGYLDALSRVLKK